MAKYYDGIKDAYWYDECRVEEQGGEPCTYSDEKHWVVFHSESGSGVAEFFSEDEAAKETDKLNAE